MTALGGGTKIKKMGLYSEELRLHTLYELVISKSAPHTTLCLGGALQSSAVQHLTQQKRQLFQQKTLLKRQGGKI